MVDGTMHEIVGESGTADGEGCLMDLVSVGSALLLLAAGVAALAWVLS